MHNFVMQLALRGKKNVPALGNAINLSDTVIKANWINITAISLKESVVS